VKLNIANKFVENITKFQYLGKMQTNINCMNEENKVRLNSGNACYPSVQNLLSLRLPTNTKVKNNFAFLMDVKHRIFLLREEYRRRVSEKRVPRKIPAPNTEKITD
jgi:hypothetical protein